MATLNSKKATNREIEVKFAVGAKTASRLQRQLPLRHAQKLDETPQHLVNVYFDTPNLELRRHGVGLRVRHVHGRKFQTVKCDGSEWSPFARFECEHEIAGDRPDLSCVEEAGLQKLFAVIKAPRRLRPLFTTDFERTRWLAEQKDGAIELAVDVGEIRTQRRRESICEVELELKSGEPVSLFDTAAGLVRKLPLRIQWQSKGERGYALAARHVSAARSAVPPKLAPKMRVHEALGVIVSSCIEQIAANQQIVNVTDNVEAVHKMRVGLRRLRSAFSLFRGGWGGGRLPFDADLRWLHRLLGGVRDWDVFRKTEFDPLPADGSSNIALKAVDVAAEIARSRAYAKLREAIESRRYTALWLKLGNWLHTLPHEADDTTGALNRPINDYAVEVLRQREKKVRKLGRRIAALDPSDLHRLRIRTKKLRYAAEFFRDLCPGKPMKKAIERVTELQELLGELNDLDACRRLLRRIPTNRGRTSVNADLVRGKRLIEGWTIARSRTRHDELNPTWTQYKKTKVPWRQ